MLLWNKSFLILNIHFLFLFFVIMNTEEIRQKTYDKIWNAMIDRLIVVLRVWIWRVWPGASETGCATKICTAVAVTNEIEF